MRINQWLARATGLSRRAADLVIANGEVKINGITASIGQTVEASDKVTWKEETLVLAEPTYMMLHKPSGYISSRQQQGNVPTIYELLPKQYNSLKPIGRLDKDSSGLLLLTNDGKLAQELSHPKYHHSKRYEITLDRPLDNADRTSIYEGVLLEDGLSRFTVQGKGSHWIAELGEGRNRQIRRTFSSLGYQVQRLHRIAIGQLQLGKIAPGQYRLIARKDIK